MQYGISEDQFVCVCFCGYLCVMNWVGWGERNFSGSSWRLVELLPSRFLSQYTDAFCNMRKHPAKVSLLLSLWLPLWHLVTLTEAKIYLASKVSHYLLFHTTTLLWTFSVLCHPLPANKSIVIFACFYAKVNISTLSSWFFVVLLPLLSLKLCSVSHDKSFQNSNFFYLWLFP